MDLYQLESIITTQIRVRVTKAIGSRFPKISFTNEQTDNTPSFPNVYIHLIINALNVKMAFIMICMITYVKK